VSLPPDHLQELDRRLDAIGFEPRASLGAEIRGRWLRGERPESMPPRRLRVFALAGSAALLGALVFWLVAGRPARQYTVDRCCQDLDGGGSADDGVVVVSRSGVTVQYLTIYEDLDQSRSYTAGDRVRFLRQGGPTLTGPLQGVRTAEFCCLDYDGGGASDDALVVMGLPPDRISMAAIYERRSKGSPAQLR